MIDKKLCNTFLFFSPIPLSTKFFINFSLGIVDSILNQSLLVLNRGSNFLFKTCFFNFWAPLKSFPEIFYQKQRSKFCFSRYFYNGLGYKIFVRQNNLFVWIGLTHYTIVPIPPQIRVFAKKKRVYFVTKTLISNFKNFLSVIRRIRKSDIYKGKGLLEIKTYKGFIKMKSGKKKQY